MTIEDNAVTAAPAPTPEVVPAFGRRRQNFFRTALNFARRKPLGAIGAAVLLLMLFTALAAPYVAPYDPIRPNPVDRLQGPSLDHFMGTDHLGRDVFSRVVYGARPSLYTGLLVVAITATIGLVLGVTSAYLGGLFDLIIQRFIDALIALPGIILAMALLSVFSSGLHIGPVHLPLVWHSIPLMVSAALCVILVPTTARVTRSATLSIAFSPYIEAAQSIGCSKTRIIGRHLIPNVLAPLIIVCSAQLGAIILVEASLSFLGLGLPPPNPSWGGMLQSEGRDYMRVAPWLAIYPGLAITIAVLAFNVFGDALRDVLDPRLRSA